MIDSETLQLPVNQESIMVAKRPAVAYLRTSSSTNVGEDKDSEKRQTAAIQAYAKRAGYEIVAPAYYDAAVSGADSIEGRAGFARLSGATQGAAGHSRDTGRIGPPICQGSDRAGDGLPDTTSVESN